MIPLPTVYERCRLHSRLLAAIFRVIAQRSDGADRVAELRLLLGTLCSTRNHFDFPENYFSERENPDYSEVLVK